MPDYNGLPRQTVLHLIASIRDIMHQIVAYICKERSDTENRETILLALESLKWIWRGKEIDCVH